jgi:hypothetical protein
MTNRRTGMKKLVSVFLAVLALSFSTGAAAGDRFDGWHGWHGGHYGHDRYYKRDHGHRSSFSIVLGAPLYWPRYNYYPYGWHSPSRVIVQQAPVTWVQREPAAPAQSEYWYFCPDTRSYYPYTQTCPSEWLQVVPQTTPR